MSIGSEHHDRLSSSRTQRIRGRAAGRCQEIGSPVTLPVSSEDRYFIWFDFDREPFAMIRRHYTDTGYEDQTLRGVNDWRKDTTAAVVSAIVNPLESDYEEASLEQANKFMEQLAARTGSPTDAHENTA